MVCLSARRSRRRCCVYHFTARALAPCCARTRRLSIHTLHTHLWLLHRTGYAHARGFTAPFFFFVRTHVTHILYGSRTTRYALRLRTRTRTAGSRFDARYAVVTFALRYAHVCYYVGSVAICRLRSRLRYRTAVLVTVRYGSFVTFTRSIRTRTHLPPFTAHAGRTRLPPLPLYTHSVTHTHTHTYIAIPTITLLLFTVVTFYTHIPFTFCYIADSIHLFTLLLLLYLVVFVIPLCLHIQPFTGCYSCSHYLFYLHLFLLCLDVQSTAWMNTFTHALPHGFTTHHVYTYTHTRYTFGYVTVHRKDPLYFPCVYVVHAHTHILHTPVGSYPIPHTLPTYYCVVIYCGYHAPHAHGCHGARVTHTHTHG